MTYEYMTHGCCKVRHTKTTKYEQRFLCQKDDDLKKERNTTRKSNKITSKEDRAKPFLMGIRKCIRLVKRFRMNDISHETVECCASYA